MRPSCPTPTACSLPVVRRPRLAPGSHITSVGYNTADHIRAEVGELVAGTATGRVSREQITLDKSVGVALQDAAAASSCLALRERPEPGSS